MTVPATCELGLVGLAAAIAAREVSCVEVARDHLAHAGAVNPAVNALVARADPEAVLAEAAERDAELARGEHRGVLHGVPQAVKDLAEVAGQSFTAGSPVFADRVGVVDAPHVARMRAAGAVFVGRTNTPELGFGSQTYNPVWGTTRNPYDLARTVGGSSGGASAALATRMLPAADGGDTMGSLRNPAAWANVYGLRPSRGRVPGTAGFVAQLARGRTDGPIRRRPRRAAGGHDGRRPRRAARPRGPAGHRRPAPGRPDGPAGRLARRPRGTARDRARAARAGPRSR